MSASVYGKKIDDVLSLTSGKAKLLAADLQLETCGDLLTFYPYRYVDRTKFHHLAQVDPQNKEVQFLLKLRIFREVGFGGKKRLTATFTDGTATLECVWFRWGRWQTDMMKMGCSYVLFGRVSIFSGKLTMTHPDLMYAEVFNKASFPKITPIYHSTERLTKRGLGTKGIQNLVAKLFQKLPPVFPEFLPAEVIRKRNPVSLDTALKNIHFPKTKEVLDRSIFRLKFDELFIMQLQILMQKAQNIKSIQEGFVLEKSGHYTHTFYRDHLPFDLTGAQKRVIREIYRDMKSGKQMNRLIQGDVGSGKTIVALMTILLSLDNGFQACLLAPTEILARQHFQSIYELTQGMGIQVSILTGSTKTSVRNQLYEDLQTGATRVLIGTHAVFEDRVKFKNLAVAIVDEQHRFGVAQRSKLWKKSRITPHILVMTATPIPRTLAMTLYGDLDVSIIDELPPGRKPIKTYHVYDKDRIKCYEFIRSVIEKGQQVYIVYPLIEESETMDYRDLERGYLSVKAFFPNYSVAKVHGKMPPHEKDEQMQEFIEGSAVILMATTVIEVGVNVPNATVMLLESADRFGLSQLHQLRGRVGRGGEASYCFMITSYQLSKEARIRMKTMRRTNDGFEIADVDLDLRGPGDLQGTRQSGMLNLKIADISKDAALLSSAREDALQIIDRDPELSSEEYAGLKKNLDREMYGKMDWGKIS